jgi:hypothetical protein
MAARKIKARVAKPRRTTRAKLPPKTGIAEIDSLDLRDIVSAVRKQRRWSPETARVIDRWYRLFLAMSYKNGGIAQFGLEERADYVWHEHITSTKRYRQDCEKIFGKFLDHTPGRPKGWTDLLEKSNAEYVAAYGIRPPNAATCCF